MEEKKSLNISCSTVTLDVFIKCVLYNELRLLSETATDKELAEAWEALYDEYAQKTGGVRSKYVFDLNMRVALLEARISAVEVASGMSERNALELLRGCGFKGSLSNAQVKAKRDRVELKTAQAELDKLSQNSGESATDGDFTRWINVVGKFMGYRINRKEVTVAEFLDMSDIMEKSNREAAKNGRK